MLSLTCKMSKLIVLASFWHQASHCWTSHFYMFGSGKRFELIKFQNVYKVHLNFSKDKAYFFLMNISVKCVCHMWLKRFLWPVVLCLYVDMWFSLLSLQFSCGSWPMLVPCSMVSPFLFWVCLFWECSAIF